MYRNDLGTWGMNLTPDRFNNALIAAAILSACKPQVRANLKQSTYAEKLLGQIRSPGTASGAAPANEAYGPLSAGWILKLWPIKTGYGKASTWPAGLSPDSPMWTIRTASTSAWKKDLFDI